MKGFSETIDHLDEWLPDMDGDPPVDEPDWLSALRRDARARLGSEPLPGRRQETWRYSNPGDLLGQRFVSDRAPVSALAPAQLPRLDAPNLGSWRVVLVNGRFDAGLSRLEGLPDGVMVAGLRQVLEQRPDWLAGRLNRIAGQGAHVFAALNTAAMHDGCVIHLGDGVQLERPLELVQLASDAGGARLIQPRHLVLLEAGARATLVEHYRSPEPSLYCTNNLLEIGLGEDAQLIHYRLQEESPNAFHLTGLYLTQAARSHYRAVNLSLGARWSRTDIKLAFCAPDAHCDIDGLYLAGDGQMVDFHLDVEHSAPACRSNQHFRGLLTGKGRAVLDGRILVAAGAQKTEAHLNNANLLLSRSAEVDSKPQLEILADDVKCSHGATVGQIDADALFYLRSRGIPEVEARRILCMGFAGEIVERVELESLRRYAEARVSERLG
jgi:Fe-S cluster assembly protein SufD